MTTKQLTITWGLVGTTLTLIGLGFAAMSISAPRVVSDWVPRLFFVLAGITFTSLFIYLLGTIKKKIASWAMFVGYTIGVLLILAEVMIFIWPFIPSETHEPQPILGVWSWLIPLVVLVLIIIRVGPHTIMGSVSALFDKIMRIRVTLKPNGNDQEVFQIDIISRNKAINRLIILGRDFSTLTILRGIAGWPVQYPLRLYNTRPILIELVGYTVTIFLADIPMQVVTWDKPSNVASNSTPVTWPIYLQPDIWTPFNVPVVLALMQQTLPQTSTYLQR
jgi:hypothetical protein